MAAPKMINISTSFQRQYMTPDGNVIVRDIGHGRWEVLGRGQKPIMSLTKAAAFATAQWYSSLRTGKKRGSR
jgi:hypothetical protein